MKKYLALLLVFLLLLSGCASNEPETIVVDGATWCPFESGELSFYYPQSMSVQESEKYIFLANGEMGRLSIERLDYAVPDLQLDEQSVLDAVSKSVVEELGRQTGMEPGYFAVENGACTEASFGECRGYELSYTVNAQISGYEFESETSIANAVIFALDAVYIFTMQSDSGNALEAFAPIISRVVCK